MINRFRNARVFSTCPISGIISREVYRIMHYFIIRYRPAATGCYCNFLLQQFTAISRYANDCKVVLTLTFIFHYKYPAITEYLTQFF